MPTLRSTDAISAANPRVIDDSRARKLSTDLKRCTYYETCATYGLNVERVFQDGNSAPGGTASPVGQEGPLASRALWPAARAPGGGSELGFSLLPRGVIDCAVPCSGPEGGGLAEEAAAGHRALQVTAQLPQPLGSVRRLHPVRAHQPGAAASLRPPSSRLSPASHTVCLPACPLLIRSPALWMVWKPWLEFMQPVRLAWPHLHACGDCLPASTPPRSPPSDPAAEAAEHLLSGALSGLLQEPLPGERTQEAQGRSYWGLTSPWQNWEREQAPHLLALSVCEFRRAVPAPQGPVVFMPCRVWGRGGCF